MVFNITLVPFVSTLMLTLSLFVTSNDGKFNAKQHIQFELHTRNSSLKNFETIVPDGMIMIARSERPSSNFDASKPTRIYIHGYQSSRRSYSRYVKAFLRKGDYNVIVVNWLSGSKTFNYMRARDRVERVGNAVAELIDFLVNIYGMRLDDLILIGHSLGAHAAGVAGQNVHSGRLPIIIGLDPAYPLVQKSKFDQRLSIDDAEYVQVIHTNGGRLGARYPIGHADFYPNWGKSQPGCSGTKSDICSHGRAHKLYIESLAPNSRFEAVKCWSYDEIKENECTQSGPVAVMGGDDPIVLRQANGVYYTITKTQSPFALNHTGLLDEVFIA